MGVLDYDIIKSIHKGTSTDVFKVFHKKTEKVMAMKVIWIDKVEDQYQCQVNRELEILSIVDHPNIISMYETFQDSNNTYIITNFYEKNLYTKLLIEPFSENQVIKYIKQLLDVLVYLQSENIIHRDIKAENILLDDNDDIILCDFGWSIISTSLRRTQCGTIEYFSPEILMEELYDNTIDLWNVGILTYELLTGVTPFDSDDERATYVNIVNLNYIIPSNISLQSIDFIKRLLTYSEDRMSLKDAINHPFLK